MVGPHLRCHLPCKIGTLTARRFTVAAFDIQNHILMSNHASKERPAVSVVIISDYGSGQEHTWNVIRRTFAALAGQDFREPAEFLFVEPSQSAPLVPSDLATILPGFRVVAADASTSYELKNAAMRAACADLVVMLDADCAPEPDWLSQLMRTARAHPEATVVSGRTTHEGSGLLNRTMAAANRAYVDVGETGPTHHISNNNALFRREAYLAHPLPTDVGPFASHMQVQAILRDGGTLFFEPRARVEHAYEGWSTELNFRREFGYGMIRTRCADPRLPYAWAVRLGYLAIPFFIAHHVLTGWWRCIRFRSVHRVGWYELPISFALIAIAGGMETSGMISAMRGQPGVESLFR